MDNFNGGHNAVEFIINHAEVSIAFVLEIKIPSDGFGKVWNHSFLAKIIGREITSHCIDMVDQLVFEDLMRERFPKLVLRVWDVLLFEGNRVMLFRTALALMELYGPALVTTKDAGDAITLLQSLAGSTFDSSQLVFTACMG